MNDLHEYYMLRHVNNSSIACSNVKLRDHRERHHRSQVFSFVFHSQKLLEVATAVKLIKANGLLIK